jgi:hypothetical protein
MCRVRVKVKGSEVKHKHKHKHIIWIRMATEVSVDGWKAQARVQ